MDHQGRVHGAGVQHKKQTNLQIPKSNIKNKKKTKNNKRFFGITMRGAVIILLMPSGGMHLKAWVSSPLGFTSRSFEYVYNLDWNLEQKTKIMRRALSSVICTSQPVHKDSCQ